MKNPIHLDYSGNRNLYRVPNRASKKTEVLILSWNKIVSLKGIERCTNLRKLDISHTGISDLSPLLNLHSLVELNISHTYISDLSVLSQLKNLRTIRAIKSKVADISPLSRVPFTHLDVSHSPFVQNFMFGYRFFAQTHIRMKAKIHGIEMYTSLYG